MSLSFVRSLILASSFLLLATARAELPHGYVDDVAQERSRRFQEIFLFIESPPQVRVLSDEIFNAELSKEFKGKYREKFGQTDTESIAYLRVDYDRFDNNKGNNSSLESQSRERRVFAEYMMKRLAEWHLDHYIRSEPAMRSVYEVKEKLKHVEVRVTKETKLEGKYSLAGNILEIIYENPICDAKWVSEMDPSAFGPSAAQENSYIFSKPIRTGLRAENSWQEQEGRTRLDLIRSHTPRLSTSYEVSAAFKAGGKTPRDSRLALGLSYSF